MFFCLITRGKWGIALENTAISGCPNSSNGRLVIVVRTRGRWIWRHRGKVMFGRNASSNGRPVIVVTECVKRSGAFWQAQMFKGESREDGNDWTCWKVGKINGQQVSGWRSIFVGNELNERQWIAQLAAQTEVREMCATSRQMLGFMRYWRCITTFSTWMACFHLNDYIIDLSQRLRFRISLSSLRLASIQPRTDSPSCDGPFCVVWAPSTMTKLRKRLRYFGKQHSPNLHQNVSKIVSKRLLWMKFVTNFGGFPEAIQSAPSCAASCAGKEWIDKQIEPLKNFERLLLGYIEDDFCIWIFV